VLLVPAGAGTHSHMLKGMQRLMVINRRNSLYETKGGNPAIKACIQQRTVVLEQYLG